MRAKFIKHYNFRLKLSQGISLILLFILIFFFIFLDKFNKKITPSLLDIAYSSINKLNEAILVQYRVKDIFKEIDLENVMKISKNSKGEIIDVDFKLENAYGALTLITNYLQNSLEDVNLRKQILKYYNEDLSSSLDSIILSIPIGVASEDIYLANLGPRIPVKINYMGYIATSVRIKLEDYGINNVLISMYIDCSITNEFIVPNVDKEIKHEYNILVASKIIQGIVPDYYGGKLETKSNILNVPIE